MRLFSGCDMKVAFNCNNRNYTLRPWQAHLMEEGLLLSNDFNDSISFECSFGFLSKSILLHVLLAQWLMFEKGSPRTHTEIRDREIAHENERVQRMTLAMHEPLLGCAMNGMKSLHRTMAKGFNVSETLCSSSTTTAFFYESLRSAFFSLSKQQQRTEGWIIFFPSPHSSLSN